jgi:hypothetical protein
MTSRLIFMLLFVSAGTSALAQSCFPAKKVYAYYQPVTPGVMSKAEEKTRKPAGNYFIYVESKKAGINADRLWINGDLFHAELKEVPTPVVLNNGNNAPNGLKESPVELVPKTSRKIYQLVLTGALTNDKVTVPSKYNGRPVVVELHYRKKSKYMTAEIKQLNPMGMY